MLHVKILSPAGIIYEGEVEHITFPGELGSFAVFSLHAPIISKLVKGNIVCYPPAADKVTVPIESGFVEVSDNQIVACIE
jgi:F-type H+-transporting ATPase subunit epsilon